VIDLKAGDVVLYELFDEVRIDNIVSIDSDTILCYDQKYKQYINLPIDYYDDMFIGKVHPILVNLWRLDDKY